MKKEKKESDKVLFIPRKLDVDKLAESLRSAFVQSHVIESSLADAFPVAVKYRPKLIILDSPAGYYIGMELVKFLKSDDRTRDIPVMVVTEHSDISQRLVFYQNGVDDFIDKPFSIEELYIRAQNLIERQERSSSQPSYSAGDPASQLYISSDQSFLLKAKSIVEQNLSNPLFGVTQLASEMHVSRTQLFRKIKTIHGLSPHNFIAEMRLEKAARLLQNEAAETVAQVAYLVGFSEHSYFAKCFRRKFGVTPREYKFIFPIRPSSLVPTKTTIRPLPYMKLWDNNNTLSNSSL